MKISWINKHEQNGFTNITLLLDDVRIEKNYHDTKLSDDFLVEEAQKEIDRLAYEAEHKDELLQREADEKRKQAEQLIQEAEKIEQKVAEEGNVIK